MYTKNKFVHSMTALALVVSVSITAGCSGTTKKNYISGGNSAFPGTGSSNSGVPAMPGSDIIGDNSNIGGNTNIGGNESVGGNGNSVGGNGAIDMVGDNVAGTIKPGQASGVINSVQDTVAQVTDGTAIGPVNDLVNNLVDPASGVLSPVTGLVDNLTGQSGLLAPVGELANGLLGAEGALSPVTGLVNGVLVGGEVGSEIGRAHV